MGLCLIFLAACGAKPEPEQKWKPEFVELSAHAELTTVTLMSELSSPEAVTECGFMYGLSEDQMKIVYSTLKHNVFTAVLTKLEYGTEYFFKAFVANGHNEIYSELSSVRTQDEPFLRISDAEKVLESSVDEFEISVDANVGYELVMPENTGGWLSYEHDGNIYKFTVAENVSSESRSCVVQFKSVVNKLDRVLIITQKGHDYTLVLPFSEKKLSSAPSSFRVEVSGDADFSVQIPKGDKWLQCTRDGRICVFTATENRYVYSRSCKVIFKSLSHDCELSLDVLQEAKSENEVVAVHEHELNYDETRLYVLIEGLDLISARVIVPDEVDWIWYQFGADNEYGFTLLVNNTGQSRYTEIVVEDQYGFSNIIKVTQHAMSAM